MRGIALIAGLAIILVGCASGKGSYSSSAVPGETHREVLAGKMLERLTHKPARCYRLGPALRNLEHETRFNCESGKRKHWHIAVTRPWTAFRYGDCQVTGVGSFPVSDCAER